MADVPLEIVRHDAWTELVLSRPERRNAVTGPLADALCDAVGSAAEDEATRAILLRGAGGAFCSGLDLKEFNADPPPAWLGAFRTRWLDVHVALCELRKPIVCALERFAINAGAALALACDLTVVGEGAFLQVGEARQGMAAPMNVAWLRLRHSEAVAARVALIADRIDGRELVRLGLANVCVPDADVLERARALASDLAAYPAGGIARIKAGLRALGAEGGARAWFESAAEADPLASAPRPRAN